MSTEYIDIPSATLLDPSNHPETHNNPNTRNDSEKYSLKSHDCSLTASMTLDWHIVVLSLSLLSVGLIMVASSSMEYAVGLYSDPWFFTKRHAMYLLIGLTASLFMLSMPTYLWHRYSWLLFIAAVLLLMLVLVPGVGRRVNGSQRWLQLGPMTLQVSELVKLFSIIFFANYFSNCQQSLRSHWQSFCKPVLLLLILIGLLLLEPDFGGALVLGTTIGAMLFLAGAKLWQCLLLLLSAGSALFVLAVFVPYRFKRLQTFLDPWQDQFDSGYQLTQSLIAFGRGEWFGLGLGNSIQKLLYLPEAHTDFIFAIYAEEFGFVGVVLLFSLFIALLIKVFLISRRAFAASDVFKGLAVFGVGVLLTIQVLINIGVTSGFMPTKGLTLPLVSYGGSSLLASCLLIAMVLRMDYDLKSKVINLAKRAL